MTDLYIAYYNKTGDREVNDTYTFHANLDNWCSDPAIIEEKIFTGDLNSSINYCNGSNMGVPHIAHFFDSLDVRKVLNYSKFTYVHKHFDNFDDNVLDTADVVIIHADVLIYLTDAEVQKLLSLKGKILVDATFEAFTYTYYYPILKLFKDKYKSVKELTLVVGTDKYNDDIEFENAFKEYTGANLSYFNFFRINEVLVGSSGINDHHHNDSQVTNYITEQTIIDNFNSLKTKNFLCLNNRPRFHRLALVEKLRELDLLAGNFVSKRWQYPAKKHIVQPLIKELWFEQEHSPRMLDELKIFNETPKSMLDKLRDNPGQLIIPELDEGPEFSGINDRTPDLIDDRIHTNVLYKNSHFSLAVETYYEDSFVDYYPEVLLNFEYKSSRTFLTEKVYKPIQYGHIFIPFAMPGTMKVLEEQGFLNFHEEFNCNNNYDMNIDHHERYKAFIEIINNFDATRITNKTLEKILHNYRLFYNKPHIMKHMDTFYENFIGNK